MVKFIKGSALALVASQVQTENQPIEGPSNTDQLQMKLMKKVWKCRERACKSNQGTENDDKCSSCKQCRASRMHVEEPLKSETKRSGLKFDIGDIVKAKRKDVNGKGDGEKHDAVVTGVIINKEASDRVIIVEWLCYVQGKWEREHLSSYLAPQQIVGREPACMKSLLGVDDRHYFQNLQENGVENLTDEEFERRTGDTRHEDYKPSIYYEKFNRYKHYDCPITQELMVDPVIQTDGHSYERKAIAQWLKNKNHSPKTKLKLDSKSLVPNRSLKRAIENRDRPSSVGDAEKGDAEKGAAEKGAYDPFFCQLSGVKLVDPVVQQDGHTYERIKIQNWMDAHQRDSNRMKSRSPLASADKKLALANDKLIPNWQLKSLISTRQEETQLKQSRYRAQETQLISTLPCIGDLVKAKRKDVHGKGNGEVCSAKVIEVIINKKTSDPVIIVEWGSYTYSYQGHPRENRIVVEWQGEQWQKEHCHSYLVPSNIVRVHIVRSSIIKITNEANLNRPSSPSSKQDMAVKYLTHLEFERRIQNDKRRVMEQEQQKQSQKKQQKQEEQQKLRGRKRDHRKDQDDSQVGRHDAGQVGTPRDDAGESYGIQEKIYEWSTWSTFFLNWFWIIMLVLAQGFLIFIVSKAQLCPDKLDIVQDKKCCPDEFTTHCKQKLVFGFSAFILLCYIIVKINEEDYDGATYGRY